MRKTVLITGASGGLGSALVKVFDITGNLLLLHYFKNKAIQTRNSDCILIQGDLQDEKTISDISEMAKKVDVDILINNAGVYGKKNLVKMEKDEIRKMVDINLVTPMILTQAIIPFFEEKQSGIIININSLAGKDGSQGEAVYCSTKHGLRGFSQSIQYEVSYTRIIDVYLGAMQTGMTDNRNDKEFLIEPLEVAEIIKAICNMNISTARLTEYELKRSRY